MTPFPSRRFVAGALLAAISVLVLGYLVVVRVFALGHGLHLVVTDGYVENRLYYTLYNTGVINIQDGALGGHTSRPLSKVSIGGSYIYARYAWGVSRSRIEFPLAIAIGLVPGLVGLVLLRFSLPAISRCRKHPSDARICHRCGYDVRGIEGRPCPECGGAIRACASGLTFGRIVAVTSVRLTNILCVFALLVAIMAWCISFVVVFDCVCNSNPVGPIVALRRGEITVARSAIDTVCENRTVNLFVKPVGSVLHELWRNERIWAPRTTVPFWIVLLVFALVSLCVNLLDRRTIRWASAPRTPVAAART